MLFDKIRTTRTIQERFDVFHKQHPEVYDLFLAFAQDVMAVGHEHYSADAILHRIRWHYDVNTNRDEGFKINDHFTSRYARLLMKLDHRFEGFFELRQLKSE